MTKFVTLLTVVLLFIVASMLCAGVDRIVAWIRKDLSRVGVRS